MCISRKIVGVYREDRLRHEEVLRRVEEEEGAAFRTIRDEQMNWLGHYMR